MTETEKLARLLQGYQEWLPEYTATLNAKKQADAAHEESKETLKAYRAEIHELMCNLGLDDAEYGELVFANTLKDVNVVDTPAAIEAIKEQGLVDSFLNVTQAALKEHQLSEFIKVEQHPALVIKVKE